MTHTLCKHRSPKVSSDFLCVHVDFFSPTSLPNLDITIFAFILEYLGGLGPLGLGGGGMGVHVGGTCPLISFSQHLLFDITVSHLSLTRSERESREEGQTERGDEGY